MAEQNRRRSNANIEMATRSMSIGSISYAAHNNDFQGDIDQDQGPTKQNVDEPPAYETLTYV